MVKDVKAPGNVQLQRRRDTRRFRLRLLQKLVVEVAQNRHFLRVGFCKERAVHVPNGSVNDGLIDGLQALLAAYDKLAEGKDKVGFQRKGAVVLAVIEVNIHRVHILPVLAAYIAYSMAGKPALAPGFVLGYLVNNAVVTPSGNSVSTGFLGAMIMAVICGYFVRWMKTWKVNNTIQTIMPILIIPILTSLVLGMAYIYILATPLGFVMDWLTGVLGSLQGGSAVVLGLVIGVMTAFDMGGPINKTASTFTMAIMASGIYGPNGMFRVAVAIPPIACGLAALIAKNKFDDADRQMGISALFMGCIGITEGAIPFAVKDLGHTLPGICIGSAVGAALAAFQGIDCYVPHGGFIVALATNNVALFCLDIVIGSVVAAAILIAMKPTLDKQAK